MRIMAISMAQPYAWLFSNGLLRVDDRSWPTERRGIIAIHAGKKFDAAYHAFASGRLFPGMPKADGFDFGGVVGVATLSGCIGPGEGMDGLQVWERSHLGGMGSQMEGRCFGLVFDGARPVGFRGERGFPGIFEVDLPQGWPGV